MLHSGCLGALESQPTENALISVILKKKLTIEALRRSCTRVTSNCGEENLTIPVCQCEEEHVAKFIVLED